MSTESPFDGMSYADALEMLRQDLQLNAATDLLSGTVLASLVDQNGQSAFAQLAAGTKNVKLAYGTATVTFTGSATASVTVSSGLGAFTLIYPSVILAGSAGQFLNWSYSTGTGTITFNATAGSVLTASFTIAWIAIGSN